jgi:hypothetical protein
VRAREVTMTDILIHVLMITAQLAPILLMLFVCLWCEMPQGPPKGARWFDL